MLGVSRGESQVSHGRDLGLRGQPRLGVDQLPRPRDAVIAMLKPRMFLG